MSNTQVLNLIVLSLVVKHTSLLSAHTVRAPPTAAILDVANEVNYNTYLPTRSLICALGRLIIETSAKTDAITRIQHTAVNKCTGTGIESLVVGLFFQKFADQLIGRLVPLIGVLRQSEERFSCVIIDVPVVQNTPPSSDIGLDCRPIWQVFAVPLSPSLIIARLLVTLIVLVLGIRLIVLLFYTRPLIFQPLFLLFHLLFPFSPWQ